MNLTDILNQQIANWTVLYYKFHNYHWYVKGPQFFTLHTTFEELYKEAALHIDELAERTLALGGEPVATMTQCLALASVQEASGNETAEQMVQATVHDFNKMIGELKIAEVVTDEITGDMFLAIRSNLEKQLWMLHSFLGK
ncbi:Dps family protein [Brevibacillus fortis]|uniref:DNA starvation/stationary phase protection protein n=1 Tax=Brevibacillus fortis TaxID=2126352 RepID=A0A2P7UKL4_9BACL|nr:Dps family protein [Brevibacillus fortis]PSJ87542.1 DNA starvation/stationary phase protection protein [Brevibacillus fortis]